VIDTDWKDNDPAPMVFVNPTILAQAQTNVVGNEGCLSIPDKTYAVMRPSWIEAAWCDLDGAVQHGRFEGINARCFCHELDHLDGVLISQGGVLQ
jgi:peptide deformylase